jgi:hypothetical protein
MDKICKSHIKYLNYKNKIISKFVEHCLSKCDTIQSSGNLLMFQKNILLLSSGSKDKPIKQPVKSKQKQGATAMLTWLTLLS